MKWLCLFALVAIAVGAPTEQGPSCIIENDCFDTPDTPYCVIVQAAVNEQSWAAAIPAATAIPATVAVAKVVDATGATTTAEVKSKCPREYPATDAKAYAPATKAVKKCLQCREDSHCSPGEFCVKYKMNSARPAHPAYFTAPTIVDDATPKMEDHSFQHEEYGDETWPVGSCAPKGYPLGEPCSVNQVVTSASGGPSSCTVADDDWGSGCSYTALDKGANDKEFCGLVTDWWPEECADDLPLGWTAKEWYGLSAQPPRKVQWTGKCIDHVCCECSIGDYMGDQSDMQCIPVAMQGTCGMWAYNTNTPTSSTYGINRIAEAQMQVVSLLLLILIAGVTAFGVCVK